MHHRRFTLYGFSPELAGDERDPDHQRPALRLPQERRRAPLRPPVSDRDTPTGARGPRLGSARQSRFHPPSIKPRAREARCTRNGGPTERVGWRSRPSTRIRRGRSPDRRRLVAARSAPPKCARRPSRSRAGHTGAGSPRTAASVAGPKSPSTAVGEPASVSHSCTRRTSRTPAESRRPRAIAPGKSSPGPARSTSPSRGWPGVDEGRVPPDDG